MKKYAFLALLIFIISCSKEKHDHQVFERKVETSSKDFRTFKVLDSRYIDNKNNSHRICIIINRLPASDCDISWLGTQSSWRIFLYFGKNRSYVWISFRRLFPAVFIYFGIVNGSKSFCNYFFSSSGRISDEAAVASEV